MRKSFLSYVGGKSRLADKIIPYIPEHICYCEVFAGAAWLLFRKDESEIEIINDINTDLVTLYRVVKNHLDEFVRYLRWILVARDEFERFKAENPETLTDIQRAVRFYFLLKTGFSSRIANPSFGLSSLRRPTFNLLRVEEELSEAHLRLSRVFVENMHFMALIDDRVDKPTTFLYLDPPYHGCEDYYGKGIFARADFESLGDRLKSFKGTFIMSINDTPEIRSLCNCFFSREVGVTYTISGGAKTKNVTELLFMNFKPQKANFSNRV